MHRADRVYPDLLHAADVRASARFDFVGECPQDERRAVRAMFRDQPHQEVVLVS
jgi:hypothetical protein